MPSEVNMTDKFITIGKIVAPHGVRGEVRVVPLTDFPERFRQMKTVLASNGKELVIEQVRYHKQFVLLKFQGFDNATAVEALRNLLLQIERQDLVKLPADHFYIFDIIGLKVFDNDGEYLGVVTDVLKTGSNDVYIAEREGKPPLLIPALKKVVENIDLAGGQMRVKLQEEWEPNAN